MILDDLPFVHVLFGPQAGGGGSFGTGGGIGGGGGDGEGIVYILYWLVRLAIAYPRIGVPLLIVVVAIGVIGSRKGWWKAQERTIRRTRGKRRARISAVSAGVLHESDPDFDERGFLARVRRAFEKAQTAWCAQDLEPLRPFVSDGVFERFSLQIAEQKEDGWRQGMEGLRPGLLDIVHVEVGRHFDTVAVRIPFQADIHRVSLADGKRIPGSKIQRTWFTECWSFLRRRGAKTISGEGLIEGKCPNCAATLRMNQSARCEYCECLARSGEFDWVLAEITQASEWRTEHEREIPGLAPYTERDPGMNVQLLEDRASVAFWRKCAADRVGGTDPLSRVAEEQLCRRYAKRIAVPEAGDRTYDADCAVGSVRTLGVLAGEEQDRAVVEVVWDGRLARVGANGKRRLEGDRHMRRTLFVFRRKAGAQTTLEHTFTTAHCRTCGAHDTGGTDPACPYCGSPRTGDRSTWLVSEITSSGSSTAVELRKELDGIGREPALPEAVEPPAGPSASELLTWAAALVHADGRIEPKERRALHSLGARAEVPPERVDELLAAPRDDGAVPEPRDAAEARAWVHSLTRLALADGSLGPREHDFLRHSAERLGVKHREFERTLRDARTELFREARAARRFAKGRPVRI